ncbi:MAG: hypothetical protein FD130_946 [Halothiobacillaceae bacterium]|nr:MAG: hypothetical protein FD130_946 [Halothiobacillaceae bacterium]
MSFSLFYVQVTVKRRLRFSDARKRDAQLGALSNMAIRLK